MDASRRNFLVAGQALLALAAIPIKIFGAAASSFGSSKAANLALLSRESLLPLLNSSFAVRGGVLTMAWLTLQSVEDMNQKVSAPTIPMAVPPKPAKGAPPKIDTFALHFHLIGETLEQGTYELEHAALGRFPLFVVPSGASTCVAVISHIHGSAGGPVPQPVRSKEQLNVPAVPESF
jgi:hypothetical protein